METGETTLCNRCNAACCRAGNRYTLDWYEAQTMGLDYRNVVQTAYGALFDDRPEVYQISEDCVHLGENSTNVGKPKHFCKIYDGDDRPLCCSSVQPGGSYCLNARKIAGYIDTPLPPFVGNIIPIEDIK